MATRKASTLSAGRGWIHYFRNSILCYTITFLIVTTLYYIFWGGIFTVLTSIEKRYSFASWQSGLIIGASEYGRVIALIPMSYLGGRSHVPRITAISTLLCACVMVLIVSPHFILEPSGFSDSVNSSFLSNTSSVENLCSLNHPVNESIEKLIMEADAHQSHVSNTAFIIFVLAMTTLGICASPLTNISITYIDINASAEKAPFYIGIANSAISFGPMIGCFVAAWATTIYVDLSYPPITPAHPDWVGAWWIIMVTVSMGVLISAPFLFLFPKRMSHDDDKPEDGINDNQGQEMTLISKPEEVSANVDVVSDGRKALKPQLSITEFLRTAWRILSNPIFVFLSLTQIAMDICVWGYYAFLSKYVEVQFSAEAWTANIISGVTVLCIGFSNITAGYAIVCLKLSYRRTAQIMIALIVVAFGTVIALMLISCPNVKFADSSLTDLCSTHCHCDVNAAASPVCDSANDVSYINACQAGCLEFSTNNSKSFYTACNCTSSYSVTPGLCNDCSQFPTYIAIVLLFFIERGLSLCAIICITIRSVDECDRGLAMGLNIMCTALIAWMPSAIIYGLVIDQSCDIWKMLGTTRGYCYVYNRSLFRYNMHGFSAGILCFEMVFMVAALVFITRKNFTWDTKTLNALLF